MLATVRGLVFFPYFFILKEVELTILLVLSEPPYQHDQRAFLSLAQL